MYMSARPALTKASDAAAKAHQPFGITISTTPNNLDVPEGKFCYDMIQKAARFTFEFYDWDDDTLNDYLDKNSANGYVFIEYHHTDLGKDDKWLKAQIRALEGDMAKVKREILIEWTYASNMSIFTEEQLDEMSKHVKPINKSLYIDNYKIDILEPFNNLMYKNWCLSIDIGGGLGKDYSAFSLIDPMSYKQVMKFKNNNISVLDFAELVIKFVKTYVPNAVIIPERNFNSAFIEAIQKSDISKNLYYTSTEDKDYTISKIKKKSIFKNSMSKTSIETRKYGFNTDGPKRKIMTDEILFMIANTRPELVNNQDLFDELRKLIRERSGKINHMNGEHDDLTMSYLIGLYVLIYSNNRNKFFKNISDEPVNSENPKKINKDVIVFKNISKYNNKETIDNLVNSNIDKELIQMQKLIDEKNKKTSNNKIKNIFDLNKI